jgi:hypothetical protein
VSVVHEAPEDGRTVTACCGRTPFELPLTDRMTTQQHKVTCDPYADCRCGHGRHTHVRYTGACGLCACAAVREA